MKTSKFFLSTLIAAAAMTANAYADGHVTYTGGTSLDTGTQYGEITLANAISMGTTASGNLGSLNAGGNFYPEAYTLMFWIDVDALPEADNVTLFTYGGTKPANNDGSNALALNSNGTLTFGQGKTNGASFTFGSNDTRYETTESVLGKESAYHIALVNNGQGGANNTASLYINGNLVCDNIQSNFNMGNGNEDTVFNDLSLSQVDGISYGDAYLFAGVKDQETIIKLASRRVDDLVWTGSESGSWSGKNWLYNSKGTFFYDSDNVTFDETGTTETISLANGESFNVGTMSVNADYSFSLSSNDTSAKISGKTLSVASGATMKLGGHESRNVNLGFDEIKLSGKIYFDNDETTWKSLEFIGEGDVGDTVRNLFIYDTRNNGLTIEKTTVTNSAQITADWGGKVSLGVLTLNADLTLNGSREAITYGISSIVGSGKLLLSSGSNMTLAFTSTGVITFENIDTSNYFGAYDIVSGVVDASSEGAKLFHSGSTWHRKANGVVVRSGAELKVVSLAYGDTLGNLSHYADNRVLDGGKITITGTGAQQGFKVTSNGGTLESSNTDASLSFAGDGSTNAIILDGALQIGGAGDISISTTGGAAISGSGSLVKFGPGKLTLSSSSDYSGGTTVSAGTLVAAHQNALGGGDVSVADNAKLSLGTASVTIKNLSGAGDVDLADGTSAATLTINSTKDTSFSGNIGSHVSDNSKVFSLIKEGSGTFALSGDNTYSGGTTVSAGTLVAAHQNALGSGPLKLNGGTFGTSLDAFSVAGAVELGEGTTSTINLGKYTNGAFDTSKVARITIDNEISGAGSLAVVGSIDADDVSNPEDRRQRLTLSGNNSYTGGTTLSGARVEAGSEKAFGEGNLTMNGSVVTIAADSLTIKNLKSEGTTISTIQLASNRESATLNLISTEDTTFAGSLTSGVNDDSKTLDLVKTGAGTLVLSGSNTLNAVTVSEGALSVGVTSFGSDVTVGQGAELQVVANEGLGEYFSIYVGRNLNLAKGSKLVVDLKDVKAAGETITLNIVSATAAINLGASVEGVALATADVPAIEDFVSITGNAHLSDYVKQTWSYDGTSLSLTLAIPEPSLFGLLAGLGVLTLVGTRRRRSKKA